MKNGGGVVFFNGFFGGLFTFTRRNMVLHVSTKCHNLFIYLNSLAQVS